MNDADRLIDDYLRRLRAACRPLPRGARDELLAEVSTHIAEAKAAGEAADQVAARNLLARLGEPEDVAAEAAAEPPRTGTGRAGGMEITAVIFLLIGGIVISVIGWVAGAALLWASPRWRWPDKLMATLIWPGGLLTPLILSMAAWEAPGSLTTCSSPAIPVNPTLPLPAARSQPPSTQCHTVAAGSASAGPPGWLWAVIIVMVLAAFAVAVWLLHRARRAKPIGTVIAR